MRLTPHQTSTLSPLIGCAQAWPRVKVGGDFNVMAYLTWTDLRIGDRFRIAGYDDLLVKVSATHAKNFGTLKRLCKPITLGKRGEVLEIAPNVGGLILAI